MDIKEIDKLVEPPKDKKISLSTRYGVMSIVLGAERFNRVKTYCASKKIKHTQLFKVLIDTYLNEKEKEKTND